MCTCVTMNRGGHYFGRTLDLEYDFDQRVIIAPRALPLTFRRQPPLPRHYAMIGMASAAEGFPLFAEAMNEKGLGMAGLYFPESAVYRETLTPGMTHLAPYELIPWLLGQFDTVEQVRRVLPDLEVAALPLGKLPLAPLHWMVADGRDCLVVESVAEGLKVYDNPAGVLTNEPPFPYHMTYLRGFLNLTPQPPACRFGGALSLTPYGQGMGALGLPGDASPASRFVRAAFGRANSQCPPEEGAAVTELFHILDSVSMVRGCVITPQGACDITRYACCADAARGVYYYKTYGNSRLTAVDMNREDLEGTKLLEFPLETAQSIRRAN